MEAFACASIEVAACDKICDLVKLLVSAAKSASSILDLAASVLTFKVVRLLIVASRRFSYAPKVALNLETVSRALSNDAKEEDAALTNPLPKPPEKSCYMGGWIIPPQITKAEKVAVDVKTVLKAV